MDGPSEMFECEGTLLNHCKAGCMSAFSRAHNSFLQVSSFDEPLMHAAVVDKENDPRAIKHVGPAGPCKKNCIHFHLAYEMSFTFCVPGIKQH